MSFNFIERFKDKFYFMGCNITTKVTNNKPQKIIIFPKTNNGLCPVNENDSVSSWIKDYNMNAKNTRHYAIRTGKISGITVLDFDTEYAYKMFCANVPNFETYFTVKTKKDGMFIAYIIQT
jgi:hypothetical protein